MAEQTPAPDAGKQCASCKKPVKKLRRFYRDGKFYCSPNCFKKSKDSAKESAEAAG